MYKIISQGTFDTGFKYVLVKFYFEGDIPETNNFYNCIQEVRKIFKDDIDATFLGTEKQDNEYIFVNYGDRLNRI